MGAVERNGAGGGSAYETTWFFLCLMLFNVVFVFACAACSTCKSFRMFDSNNSKVSAFATSAFHCSGPGTGACIGSFVCLEGSCVGGVDPGAPAEG